jgi:chemotaxis protein methyltransferase CheR
MDLIFCRNVLMYFGTERARQVGRSLYCALINGGWLMVGASEMSRQTFPLFEPVHLHGAIVYRKTPAGSRTPASFPFEEIPPQEVLLRPLAQASSGIEPPPFSNSEMAPEVDSLSPQQPVFAEASGFCLPEHEETAVKAGENEAVQLKAARSVRILANQGRLMEALVLCEKAIAADKLDPGLHYLRATILQEQNREDEAIASLKRSLYLAPDFVMAHFVLGSLLLRRRDMQKGKRCFENALVLLNACGREDILPESDGLTTGRFREIVDATMRMTRDDF